MATASTSASYRLKPIFITSYEPDVEYVDDELEERNGGEFDHNMIQRAILFWFYSHEKEWSIAPYRRAADPRRCHQNSSSGRERFLARASDRADLHAASVDCDRGPVPGRLALSDRRKDQELHKVCRAKHLDRGLKDT
jgi:hypothetical protein